MNKIVYILLALFMMSCNSGHYNSVRINGLKYGEFYEDLLFISPSIGLLGGYEDKHTYHWDSIRPKGFQNFDAICLRTIDGGKNWEKQKMDDGIVNGFTIKDGIIYASIQKSDSTYVSKTVIYTSNDQGKNWKKKCELDTLLVRLHVIDSNWIIGNTYGKLNETRDGGNTWNELKTNNFVWNEFYAEGYVYYFSDNNDGIFKTIVRRDLDSGHEREMPIPDNCEGTAGSGDIIFCRNNEELRVYEIDADFKFSYLYSFKKGGYMSAQFIGRHNEQIYLLIFSPRAGLFSLQDCFYYSPDGGKEWIKLGRKGYIDSMGKRVSSYGDSTSFRLFFYKDIYSMGIFNFSNVIKK